MAPLVRYRHVLHKILRPGILPHTTRDEEVRFFPPPERQSQRGAGRGLKEAPEAAVSIAFNRFLCNVVSASLGRRTSGFSCFVGGRPSLKQPRRRFGKDLLTSSSYPWDRCAWWRVREECKNAPQGEPVKDRRCLSSVDCRLGFPLTFPPVAEFACSLLAIFTTGDLFWSSGSGERKRTFSSKWVTSAGETGGFGMFRSDLIADSVERELWKLKCRTLNDP